jgi:hypothetical protein
VHTSVELNDSTFAISVDGAPATVDDLFPGFDDSDRLGVVVGSPHGLVGASLLVLAAVHRFYERQRELADSFWIYADYFAFHVDGPYGYHGELDIWPPHKEVVVPADGNELLRAINDRGVTRLVVETDGADPGPIEDEALASARARLRSAYAYSPAGRTAGADVQIAGNSVTDGYVAAVLHGHEDDPRDHHLGEVERHVRDAIAASREQLVSDGRTVESYRRLSVDEALAALLPVVSTSGEPRTRAPAG